MRPTWLTLRDLVREAMANEAAMKRRIRTVLRSSYSNHYRRMLPQLLAALEFRCNNSAYRPVMDAIDLLRRYAERKQARWYDYAAIRQPLDPGDFVADLRGRLDQALRPAARRAVVQRAPAG